MRTIPFNNIYDRELHGNIMCIDNQIDEDRHDYSSLANVELDINSYFNTYQIVCNNYNEKEFNDEMSTVNTFIFCRPISERNIPNNLDNSGFAYLGLNINSV